ncbi:MAG: alpha/beta hydrolase [bacterium]
MTSMPGANAAELINPSVFFMKPCLLNPESENEISALCADLELKENRDQPSSRLITLPLVYVPATDVKGSDIPLFLLQGGPGASNIWNNPKSWMYRRQPLVMVGYRGADGSSTLLCPDLTKGQLGLGNNLTSSESKALFASHVFDCSVDLQKQGFDLNQYTMMQVIEDIEEVRKKLGVDKINLLSESYGTRVAYIYGRKYPGVINRSVMIGVNPPGHFVWEPTLIDEQLNYMSRLCEVDTWCNQRTDNLAGSIRKVVRTMPDSWFGFPIDPGKVRFLAMNFLHNVGGAAIIYDIFLAADQGDHSGLALLTLMYNLQMYIGTSQPMGDLFSKGMVDYEPSRDYGKDMYPPESIMGSAMSELLMAAGPMWPHSEFPAEYRKIETSAVNTLMINGSIDFSTPIQNARNELLPILTNGHLVELKEMGHVGDVYNRQPAATEHLVLTYFKNGIVDKSKFENEPFNFVADNSFPLFMKLGLLILVFMASLLVLLVCWVVKIVSNKVA